MTNAEKLAAALKFLRDHPAGSKYALDLQHTRERWKRMAGDVPQDPPPQAAKVRRLRP